MPETDLQLLVRVASEAGRVATSFTGETAKRWEKPQNAGPVTEADIAVNELLENELRTARPEFGWLSEESEDSDERLDRERVFIVDPIDGTRSFADGSRTWAHVLAIVENGVVTAGVVYLPRREMMFSAAKGQGAFLNGETIQPSDRAALEGADILAARPNMNAKHWIGGTPAFNQSHRPSLAYRMALVARGAFDGMLTLRPCWEWDIAAGDLILREAGAICTDKAGEPLRFNNPTPKVDGVLAAGAALHSEILGALS